MAGTDNVVFNTRERPLSTDWNNVEAMLGRTLMDLLRYGSSVRYVGSPLEFIQNWVAGGLVASPSGSDVSISAGVLLQDSATLAPVPGSLDSSYRIGINRTATTVVMPAPGGTTYYLIEAQMVEVTTSTESRDILDAGTGVFVPAMVPKLRERRVQFQLLTGGANAPAPSGGDWVPIAIIRRPGGGGPVVQSDIIDVRQMLEIGSQRPPLPAVISGGMEALDATSQIRLAVEMNGAFGRMCYNAEGVNTDVSAVQIISPATVLAANTWYYLYLSPWSLLAARPRILSTYTSEGVLVLSSVAPSAETRLNSGAISLPAPYGVVNAAAGTAYLVAALRRNSGNTGWITEYSPDMVEFRLGGSRPSVYASTLPVAGANPVVPIAGSLPTGYREALLYVLYLGNTATAGFSAANLRQLGLRDAAATQFLDSGFMQVLETAGGAFMSGKARLPKQAATDTFDILISAGAIDAGSRLSIDLEGFKL